MVWAWMLFSGAINATPADSLGNALAKAKADTHKVNLYIEAFNQSKNTEAEKAEAYAAAGLELAEKLNFTNGALTLYKAYGSFLDIQGRYGEAEGYLAKGLALAKEKKDQYHLGILEQAIGILEYDQGRFPQAHEHLLRSLRYRETINDVRGIADASVWLGVIQEKGMKQYNEALRYYRGALASYQKAGLQDRMGYAYNNIGNVYYTIQNFDSSLYYYLRSLDIKKKLGDPFALGSAYNNIANVYTDLQQYPTALKYYDSALVQKEQAQDYAGIATHYVNVGLVYYHMQRYDEAERAISMGLERSRENELSEITLTAYEALAKVAYAKGDYQKAYQYLGEYTMRRDTAFSKEAAQQVADMQAKYETEKKDLEISKRDLELSRKRVQIGILIGSMLMLALVAYLLYNRYKLKKQRELDAELATQRELRTKAIIDAEEKERIRIARELHDGVGQQISAVKMNLGAFADRIQEGPENREQYQLMLDLVDDAVKEVRSVSHNMMPNALIRFGLAKAVREFIDKIAATGALKIDLQIVGLTNRLESTTETVLYRVMQETVSNIIKHAGASHIGIQLIRDGDSLTMMIEDNGKGFDTRQIAGFEGIGLKNIISRVEYLDGTVDFDSYPGKGTTVIVELNLNKES